MFLYHTKLTEKEKETETYEFSKGKNLYFSVSKGFSHPTVAETLTPEGQLNPDILPEIGINYEIGFKGNFLKNKITIGTKTPI